MTTLGTPGACAPGVFSYPPRGAARVLEATGRGAEHEEFARQDDVGFVIA